MTEENAIQLRTRKIFRLKTAHGTFAFIDGTFNLILHKPETDASANEFPLYVRRLSDRNWQFFFVKNHLTKYVGAIDSKGRANVSETPIAVNGGEIQWISAIGRKDKKSEIFNAQSELGLSNNELDGSIAIRQYNWYWSANNDTGRFDLAERNRAWEHFFLEPIESVQFGKVDAVILALQENTVPDEIIARLNIENVNIIALLLKNKTTEELEAIAEEKKIPAAAFGDIDKFLIGERDRLWLLFGSSVDEARDWSKYLQSRGISSANIVNCNAKMRVTPKWTADLNSVEENGFDFFVIGGKSAAAGINVDMIISRKGINLAADYQDLRQMYRLARHLFSRCKSFKFALIGLTPELLTDDDAEFFAEQGLDGQYVFNIENSSSKSELTKALFKSKPVPAESEDAFESVENFRHETPSVEFKQNNLRILEDIVQLCLENGAMPIILRLPIANDARRAMPREKLEFMRRMLQLLSKAYACHFIDFCELPIGVNNFSDSTLLNNAGAAKMSNFLNYELHKRGILPFEEMRFVDYERIYGLMSFLSRTEYNETLDRIFDATLEQIRKKEKVKVGFVLYDASMWCGDDLYQHFINDERFETTVFLCLRKDSRNDLISENFKNAVKNFKAAGINVFAVVKNSDTIPKQDVLIYLTPYFHYLPHALRTYNLTPETLIAYVPYTLGVDYLSIVSFKIHFVVWKLFSCTNEFRRSLIRNNKINARRMVYSGSPKIDLFFEDNKPVDFQWKTARPDAVKIIWAPHWSIKGRPYVRFGTFNQNYKFMYEYAKAHPETSWVVKPHQNLKHLKTANTIG